MARGIERLVERNIGLAAMRAAAERRRDVADDHEYLPVVTISREPGAGGTTIGREVAERLGFACWDQELLTRIAEQADAVESVMAHVDERATSSVQEFVRSLLVGHAYTQDAYRTALTKVVGSIALNGAAVIVGRGGHFILGARALRVRVVCDFGERVARVERRDGLTRAEASRRVRELDTSIRAFMRHHFSADVTEPHHYDLMLNSGTLDAGQAAELVVAAYHVKAGLSRRSNSMSAPRLDAGTPPSVRQLAKSA